MPVVAWTDPSPHFADSEMGFAGLLRQTQFNRFAADNDIRAVRADRCDGGLAHAVAHTNRLAVDHRDWICLPIEDALQFQRCGWWR